MDTTNNLFDATDAVQDMFSPKDKQSADYNLFGLNISRSQSAAPMFTTLSSSVSPPRSKGFPRAISGGSAEIDGGKKPFTIGTSDDGFNGGFLFGGPSTTPNHSRRNFFEHDDADNAEVDFPEFIKRPASTGGIDRKNSNENSDVNSILETLLTEDIGVNSNSRESNNSSSALGGTLEQDSMIRHEGEHVSSSSKASKYFSRNLSNEEEELGAPRNFGGYHNRSTSFQTGGGPTVQQQYKQQSLYSQFGQQHHQQQQQQQPQQNASVPFHSHQQQWSVHEPPQQMFYNQQQSQYTLQQSASQLQNAMTGSQPTMFQINPSNASNVHQQQFGYDFQQQQQQNQQQPHIVLQQGGGAPMYQPHQQPQFISIVPIQATHAPPMINGHAGYAYVQYGPDGSMQLHHPQPVTMPNTPATFIMGPHGQPIALASLPINTNMGFPAGTSPPEGDMMHNLGGARSPTRGGGLKSDRGPRAPSTPSSMDGRTKTKGNGLSSPRGGGKRGDKNAVVPSRMGPVAAGLLNDIRAAKSRNQWTVHDISGHVVEFCLDQNGSRFIQQRLEVADAMEKKAVVDELVPSIQELQNDVFGNYVIQKLFEFGNDDVKRDLKSTLKGNMRSLSLQMYGCRVIQKALESLDYDDLCELLQEFKHHVISCIQDQNGNHVMQKCVEVISIRAKEAEHQSRQAGVALTMSKSIQFIVNDVLANVESLCCHPYGCRVLQRMLEHCVEFQKEATLNEIQLCHKTLMDDQYGNYVIQHVLQYGRDSDRDSLLNIIIENNLLKLSRQKFASNVVEKLLKYGNSHQRNTIVREMLKVVHNDALNQEGTGSTVLLLMVRDAYANYVVQTAIDVVPEGTERRMLVNELKANEAHLRNYTFAKHIVAKLGTK